MTRKQKKLLLRILIAAGLMGILHFIPVTGILRFFLYLIPYLIIGHDLLRKAAIKATPIRVTADSAELKTLVGETAELIADLVTDAADDAVGPLADRGIGFVLLAPVAEPATEAAQSLRRTAAISLDQRDRLEPVGETARGSLWRVSGDIEPRPGVDRQVAAIARWIFAGQALVLMIAVLLAIPTAQTRRDARRVPRVVGLRAGEGR